MSWRPSGVVLGKLTGKEPDTELERERQVKTTVAENVSPVMEKLNTETQLEKDESIPQFTSLRRPVGFS